MSNTNSDYPLRSLIASFKRSERISNRHYIRATTLPYPRPAGESKERLSLFKGITAQLDHPLSKATTSQTLKVLSLCLADSTLENYHYGLQAFLSFCNRERVPETHRLPASEFLLCAFAASRAGSYVRSSVQNVISAVRAWHIIHGVPWNGGPRLSYVLNGVEQMAPEGKPPRPPVSRDMLDLLHSTLDDVDPESVCVLAAADTAFWGQTRLGELFATSKTSYDPKRVPARHHLSTASSANGSQILHLPYTKTKKYIGDDCVITRQHGASDPIESLRRHTQRNSHPDLIPLFSYQDNLGNWICLTKKRFLQVCNSVWKRHGIPHTSGHSFRIGGTTELLIAGVKPDVVKMMGRWSSDAFLRYWRHIEIIIPMHAELLRPRISPHVRGAKRTSKRGPIRP